jgi:hypothetical protein
MRVLTMPATPFVDLVTGIISFLLTLMILSYLIGDNPLFRAAVYIFVGVSAGYAAAVAWWQVLFPRLMLPLLTGGFFERILALVALILGVLLLMKLSPRTAPMGNVSIAFLVGVSAAVAVGGAVIGTILPQTQASINVFDRSSAGNLWLERLFFGAIMLIGTITTLVYFHFGAKSTPDGPQRSKLVITLGWIGQVFIAITLGVLFAGVFAAAMTALIERLSFIWFFLAKLL